jgi:hypothetical protein
MYNNWYVMVGRRYGWETLLGPFKTEEDAQQALKSARLTTLDPVRVMQIK